MTKKTEIDHQKILNDKVREYEAQVEALEQELVDYALEHNLYLSLGDYGSSRTLLLEDHKWAGKERGEWLHSSESC